MLAAGGRQEIGRPEASSKSQKTLFDPWHGQVIAKHNRRRHFSCPERRQFIVEEFRLILSEVDKYNQTKAEIRGHQKQSGGLSEDKKNRLFQRA